MVYIDLVKQFYVNFRIDEDHVASYVNNTRVVFDDQVINEMFGATPHFLRGEKIKMKRER